jgi:hypothetical protein
MEKELVYCIFNKFPDKQIYLIGVFKDEFQAKDFYKKDKKETFAGKTIFKTLYISQTLWKDLLDERYAGISVSEYQYNHV